MCSTRPSDQGCLYCRLAFVLPSTVSSHSHWVPADKLSTQPGSLDQGCLYCRLAFVLPWTVSSHSHWVPADKLSTQPGSLDQGCLYCRLAFVLPWTVSSHSHWVPADKLSTQPGSLDQGCRCSRPVLVLPHCLPLRTLNEVPADQTRSLGPGVSVLQTSLGTPLALSVSTSQVLTRLFWIRGVCAADQPWCSPLPASSHSN